MSQRPSGQLSVGDYTDEVTARTAESPDPAATLCSLAVDTLDVAGAGLALLQGDTLEWVAVSDRRAGWVDAVEYTLGEGPCVTAARSGAPALDRDLTDETDVSWPAFRHEALRVGIRAAFGMPLLVGSVCIGALNLYCDLAGDLGDGRLRDAAVVARVSGRTLLDWQSAAPLGALAWQLEGAARHRVVVHQAVGRISVRSNLNVADAHALLRAYAFAQDRPVLDVAVEVAAGRLRIDG